MLPLLPLLAATALGPANLPFHLMMVKEVYAGSDAAPNAQYVVLQMYAPGQHLVNGTQLRIFDDRGVLASTFTFAGDVAIGLDQSTILIATAEAQAFFGPGGPLAADLTMQPVLPALGGKACFYDPFSSFDIDCVSWGGFSGSPAGVGTPFNAPVGLVRGAAIRRRLDICGLPTILDGCDDTDNSATDFVAATPAPRNNAGMNGAIPASVCGDNVLQSLEQCDDGNLSDGDGCSASCLREASAFTPQALVVDPTQNGVLEPGEEVALRPTWRNASTAALPLSGSISVFSGPPGAIYVAVDRQASYGTVDSGATASCTGDCYAVAVSNPPTRPALHWDAGAAEVMSNHAFKAWLLHVGGSFTDVPTTNPFYRFVETLLHRGVTGGCTTDAYCPSSPTTRDSMAVFVLVAKEGTGYDPPACTTPVFADVPASSPFCKWIEELARRGVVSGCGGGNYCPTAAVTREAMAVFALRTLDPSLDPPACGTPMFADVPASSPFCRWIEELARRGVVAGCGGGNYCPTAAVTRDQMGVFLSSTFGLTLYGL